MARSFYEARNRFVLNSKMDEDHFKVWLTLYLRGISVSEAIEKFPKMAGDDAPIPSAKTITTLFRRIGQYIFHKGFEPHLWSVMPDISKEKLAQGQQAYQEYLDEVAGNTISNAIEAISLEHYHALASSENVGNLADRISLEIRALMIARKGISDPRADVGLAMLRALTPGALPRSKMNAEHVLDMAENVLQHMLNDPMDEHGNLHSFLLKDPAKIHLNNNGAFDKKYWPTHGVSIAQWKKRQKHKKEKRRLGYVCTYEGEETLQEQREALKALECSEVFEDVDLRAGDKTRAGLEALLNEAFEFDTIVVVSLDRFGLYDERWRETMRTLWHKKVELCAINDEFDTSKQIVK